MKHNRSLLIGLFIAIFAGLIWQFIPLSDAKERIQSLPLNGLNFQGQDIDPNDFEKQFFYNANLLKRSYTINDEDYLITIIDGTYNRHLVHDPYYCFKGSGWTVESTHTLPTPKGNAHYVLLKSDNDDRKDQKDRKDREAIYWFSDGKSQFASPIRYWLTATLRRLTLGLSGPEPVLVVIQSKGDKPIKWKEFSESFNPLFEI